MSVLLGNGVGGGNDSKIDAKIKEGNQHGGTLVGQTHAGKGGFGTSDTNGTKSHERQTAYQKGEDSITGSQNGSTGYKPHSTKGTYDTSLRGSNGGMDGDRSGKGSGTKKMK